MILFGGIGASKYNDLWWYDPATATWTQKIAQGAAGSPTWRAFGSAVWDTNVNRLVLFGGSDTTTTHNDLWWYDPGTNAWTQKIADGVAGSPAKRGSHQACFAGGRVLVFGGSGSGTSFNDLWAYDSTTNSWLQKLANGAAGSPVARPLPSFAGNPAGKCVLFGGMLYDAAIQQRSNQTWTYDLGTNTWTKVTEWGEGNYPSPREYSPIVWDGARKFVLFGGNSNVYDYSNDVWWFSP